MRVVGVVVLTVLVAVLSSCGGGGGGSSSADDSGVAGTPAKVPSITQFPKVRGRTMTEIASKVPAGPVLAPSVSLLEPGKARFGFGLFDRSRKQITDAPGAVYIAKSPTSKAYGPYPARWESLGVKGHSLSKTVAPAPDAAKTLYVADVPFKKPGKYVVLGLFRLDNRLVGAGTTVKVVPGSNVPAVGDPGRKIPPLSPDTSGGGSPKMKHPDPPTTRNNTNFPAASGRKPTSLLS